MKKEILILIILVLSQYTYSQVNSGYYTGYIVEEYVWSRTDEEYKQLEILEINTEIVFSPKYIYFKKGENANWLENKWEFDETVVYDDGSKYDRYFDQMNQMILIDYVNSEILYYYNWDLHSNMYSNIAIYKNLKETTSSNSKSEEEQEVIAKFIITDASVNGKDNTPIILDQGAYTVFYTFQNDGLIYMANYWPKDGTQSFGPMYSAETTTLNETYENYKADIFYYNWRYTNDYNEKTGTAKVELIKIYKPQGVAFILKIIPENLDIIIYKGYMEGTIDFSNY